MPAPLIKSFAKKSGKSEEEVEKLWKEAKQAAEKEGHEDDYAYIVGILKRMLGLKESIFKKVLSKISEGKFFNEFGFNPDTGEPFKYQYDAVSPAYLYKYEKKLKQKVPGVKSKMINREGTELKYYFDKNDKIIAVYDEEYLEFYSDVKIF